jgi:hypothetical protein
MPAGEVGDSSPDDHDAPTTTGDGGFPCIQIGGSFLYNTYPDVSYMYPECILHVFRCVLSRYIKIHQDTLRYIKIHQDTSRYIKIHLYLSLCSLAMVMASKHSPHPRDMYPACRSRMYMYPACISHVSSMYLDYH